MLGMHCNCGDALYNVTGKGMPHGETCSKNPGCLGKCAAAATEVVGKTAAGAIDKVEPPDLYLLAGGLALLGGLRSPPLAHHGGEEVFKCRRV